MSNTYFQFKQFRIDQNNCAMKVCTDSCILGAYAKANDAQNILDIGTGTGLLSLMVAQRTHAIIEAVEVEEHAYSQAKNNFSASLWADRLSIYHNSIQRFSLERNAKYDTIICNPPFFTNQLKSTEVKKNIALHSEALTFKELIEAVSKLLEENGHFISLLPAYEFDLLKNEAANYNLYPISILKIKDKKQLPVIRIISTFSTNKQETILEDELIIKYQEGKYTEQFQELLKDYYLNL